MAANGAIQFEGPQGGMTLHDYFAAKAMQGILFEGLGERETAESAYAMADAMLKARNAAQ